MFLHHTNQTDLKNNTRLLQQVRSHVGADDVVPPAEADLNVFPKATAVVISSCFCISNSLADREQSVIKTRPGQEKPFQAASKG